MRKKNWRGGMKKKMGGKVVFGKLLKELGQKWSKKGLCFRKIKKMG